MKKIIREQLVESTGKSQHVPNINFPLARVTETKRATFSNTKLRGISLTKLQPNPFGMK